MADTRQEILTTLLEMAQEGKQIAQDMSYRGERWLKPDGSVLTKADVTIAELMHTKLAALHTPDDHLLVDEEDANHYATFDNNKIDDATYTWSIDPIDGTRNFAAGLPVYGISIGVLKNRQPYMGVVYMPDMNEMYLHDGEKAEYIQNPFTDEQVRTPITPAPREADGFSLVVTDNGFRKTHKIAQLSNLDLGASVVNLCWTAHGRAVATTFTGRLWDMAGPWPILKAAGCGFYNMHTLEEMDTLDLAYFRDNPKDAWHLDGYYLATTPEVAAHLKQERLSAA